MVLYKLNSRVRVLIRLVARIELYMARVAESEAPARVALCLAGAMRGFDALWPSVHENIVLPTAASVFAVISNEQDKGAGSRYRTAAERMDLRRLRGIIGPPLRGAIIWTDAELTQETMSMWAGREAANARKVHYAWGYFLKMWACNRLVAEDPGFAYDVIVTMRPDLFVFKPWKLSILKTSGTHHQLHVQSGLEWQHKNQIAHHPNHIHGAEHQHRFSNRSLIIEQDQRQSQSGGVQPHVREAQFALQVGADSPLYFQGDELVMHAFTLGCINDWIAVSSVNASTTFAQLVHHMDSAEAFMPCRAGVGSPVNKGSEIMLGAYLW